MVVLPVSTVVGHSAVRSETGSLGHALVSAIHVTVDVDTRDSANHTASITLERRKDCQCLYCLLTRVKRGIEKAGCEIVFSLSTAFLYP